MANRSKSINAVGPVTQRTAERTEYQIHQSGVPQQQPWFLAGLQPQGVNGGHQQAEQLHSTSLH